MPNMDWNCLTPLQLGRYAEYFAKMEFASYGYEVYTSEVDDHGVDFVTKLGNSPFLEVQVKSVRGNGYVFMNKNKFDITNESLLLCLLIFEPNKLPEIYLIPATAWAAPNEFLVSHDYRLDQKSKPEWGLNLSKKNMKHLAEYKAQDFFTDRRSRI